MKYYNTARRNFSLPAHIELLTENKQSSDAVWIRMEMAYIMQTGMHRSYPETHGFRLRKLKTKMKGIKLADGKPFGGKCRLTDAIIDQLQNYYSLIIGRNVSSLQ